MSFLRYFAKKSLRMSKEKQVAQISLEEKKLVKKEKSVFDLFVMFAAVAILLVFILWIGLNTKSNLYLVFIGFAPTIIYVILTVYLLEKNHQTKQMIWLTPVAFSVIFYYMGSFADVAILQQMQIWELTYINLFISYSFAAILNFVGIFDSSSEYYKKRLKSVRKEKHELESQIQEFIEAGKVNEDNLSEYIQSIEDKCKALNFAVGRVYSNKNGGSKDLRNLLKVKPAWYNEFSKLADNYDTIKKESALELINMILERLNTLWNKEEMFGDRCFSLLRLDRDEACQDKVIDVIIKNDKDPVRTYFESAIDYCLKIKEFLER